MLKHMIKKGYVDINKILIDLYPKMNLNEQELVLVLNLVELYKNNQKTLSVSTLSKRTNMTSEICSKALNGLLNKGYIALDIEYTKTGKAKEIFNIDDLINTISNMMTSEIKTEKINESENLIKEMIELLEKNLNKALTPYELDVVLSWIDHGVTIENLNKSIDIALSKKIVNIKYIGKILLNNTNETEVFDEENSKVLDDIFRNLK